MASADSLPISYALAVRKGRIGRAGPLSWRDARLVDEASIGARARRIVRAGGGVGHLRFCSLEPLPRCATLQRCLLRAQECPGQRLRPRYAARPSLFKLMQDRELRVGAHADCAYAIIFENGQHAGQALALFLCVGAEARRAPHREQRSEHLLRCSRRSLAALLLERKFPAGRPWRARARRNFRESRTQTCWFAMGKQWICHSAWVARSGFATVHGSLERPLIGGRARATPPRTYLRTLASP